MASLEILIDAVTKVKGNTGAQPKKDGIITNKIGILLVVSVRKIVLVMIILVSYHN